MKNRNLLMILMVLVVALLAWELWPKEMRVRTFSYDEKSSPDLLDACIGRSGIPSATWELTYPKQVELNAESTVTLSVIPSLTDEIKASGMCSQVTIAANLEIPGSVIEPGDIIFTSFEDLQPIQISWRVFENALEFDGKLWIYALPGDTRNLINQIPLFVIPINIEVISLFGLEPRLLRIIGLIGLFLIPLFFALVLQHRME